MPSVPILMQLRFMRHAWHQRVASMCLDCPCASLDLPSVPSDATRGRAGAISSCSSPWPASRSRAPACCSCCCAARVRAAAARDSRGPGSSYQVGPGGFDKGVTAGAFETALRVECQRSAGAREAQAAAATRYRGLFTECPRHSVIMGIAAGERMMPSHVSHDTTSVPLRWPWWCLAGPSGDAADRLLMPPPPAPLQRPRQSFVTSTDGEVDKVRH